MAVPEESSIEGYGMSNVRSNASAVPAASSTLMPSRRTPSSARSRASAASVGASVRHGGHAAYQVLRTTTSPIQSPASTASPW